MKITVSGEYTLAEGALAHQAIEQGHVRGKLLLRMSATERPARMIDFTGMGLGGCF